MTRERKWTVVITIAVMSVVQVAPAASQSVRSEARVHDYSVNLPMCDMATTTILVAVSCPPTVLNNGSGSASAVSTYGALNSSASFVSSGAHGYTQGFARMDDIIRFGAGAVPTDVAFHIAVNWSMSGTNLNPGTASNPNGYANLQTGIGTAAASANWSQYLDFPSAGLNPVREFHSATGMISYPAQPGGYLSLPTYGGSTFDFGFAAVVTAYFLNGSGTYTVSNYSAIDDIRFFSNGTDITGQVTATFASGHDYGLGEGTIATPEPAGIVLTATGLLMMAGVRIIRRSRQRVVTTCWSTAFPPKVPT